MFTGAAEWGGAVVAEQGSRFAYSQGESPGRKVCVWVVMAGAVAVKDGHSAYTISILNGRRLWHSHGAKALSEYSFTLDDTCFLYGRTHCLAGLCLWEESIAIMVI